MVILFSNFVIPVSDIVMSGICGCFECLLSGIGSSVTGENPFWNCSFMMLDLAFESDVSMPSFLSGGIFEHSVFCVLMSENNFWVHKF